MALNNVRKARVLADNKELKKAKDKVDGTKTMLEGVKVDDPAELIKALIYDLQQLSSFMKTQTDYEEKGRPYALSFETSHDRQRYAARGDVDKVRSFATPRMNAYLQQAKVFDINPRLPPPKEADDVKKEQEEREKQERKEHEERKERERKEHEERKERERKEQEERKEREREEQERKEREEHEEQKRKEQEEREERERKEQEEREEQERKKVEELEEQKRKELEKRFYFINIVNLVLNFIYNVLLKWITGRRT
ncbi:hypothetical protein TIFTF001_022820 [Ficus carica]|uniref:VWA-Hint protein Vwaint domain-containing protein n=1 Tax=Ficus carica TaxID=3494 RepID=A0AA88AW96_FICCA|nr:hypothetical protein TIFTF001_022820 [Ficus carica]